ncbi:hypothetical protein MFIFM68171_03457 [Madurella fahalii]|uniref:C2H2-type domain-containing protein n=1 Tax=Madurella fahalii TaxID=1157608 RepID=A0ABQ0G691_9PEZI
MPYDPEWISDEDGIGYMATPGAAEVSAAGENSGQAEQQSEDDEEHRIFDEGEGMDVDLPQPDLSANYKEHAAATPRNRPFGPVAALGKPSQVAVVLHSSPRRDGFTPADELSDEEGNANLVTSDIAAKPKIKRPELSAARVAAVVPSERQATAASSPLPTVTPQPKKRGRPFGWRLGSGPYSAMTGGVPSSTPRPKPTKPVASDQKPRRRPGRKPAPTARQVYLKLNPHFVSFRCEWENCPAELQNLETLRRHLLVVHGRPSSPPRPSRLPPPDLTCRWTSCTHPSLPSRESFAAHIEKAHLSPFLWHVGDGPRNTPPWAKPDTSPLPTYLFDAQGMQVTPSIRDQQFENDDDRKKRQVRIHRIIQQRDSNAPEEPQYTQEELAEMAAVMGEKQARQRMFREYADRVCEKTDGEGDGEGRRGRYGPEWRGIMAQVHTY